MIYTKVLVNKTFKTLTEHYHLVGYQTRLQNKLFYTNLNLDQRIRKDHILRKINAHIDFDFIYNEAKDKYGFKGSVTRRRSGKSTLKYQIHHGVDQKCEVITAAEVTPREVHESHRLESLINSHEKNTKSTVDTAVADSKYGSIENYLACRERSIKPHFKHSFMA